MIDMRPYRLPSRWRAAVILAILATCMMWLVDDAWARPGGGQHYRGSRTSSGGYGGGGGGGGDAMIFYLLFRLVFQYPAVGIPLLLIVGFVIYTRQKNTLSNWSTGGAATPRSAPLPRTRRGVSGPIFAGLIAHDPNFSEIVTRDFLYRLYASLHGARGDHAAMRGLKPYITGHAQQVLESRAPVARRVERVIIGSLRFIGASVPPASDPQGRVTLEVEFEANMTLTLENGTQRGMFSVERWTLQRAASARSRAPDGADALGCPNCGAPFETGDDRTCDYCGEVVADGRFDWQLCAMEVVSQASRPPAVGSYAEETGTFDPLVEDPALHPTYRALMTDDPNFSPDAFNERVKRIFDRLNESWSSGRLEPARPYVSEGMFDYLRYWIESYAQAGLQNRLENMNMDAMAFARIRRDAHFDAITVRVWGSGLDYTVAQGTDRVVGGSQRTRRRYSEYWTLIRSSDARGPARVDERCPNCGAALRVGMAGACEYCGAHVTRGEFDWVLATIEQDEAYQG